MKIKQGSIRERLAHGSAGFNLLMQSQPLTAQSIFEAVCEVADMPEEERAKRTKETVKQFRKEYNGWRDRS